MHNKYAKSENYATNLSYIFKCQVMLSELVQLALL